MLHSLVLTHMYGLNGGEVCGAVTNYHDGELWSHRKEIQQRELEYSTEKWHPFAKLPGLLSVLRSIITYLLLPTVIARSQCHGTAQEAPFCLAVCTEAKPRVVELKVDMHTEVNPNIHELHSKDTLGQAPFFFTPWSVVPGVPLRS